MRLTQTLASLAIVFAFCGITQAQQAGTADLPAALLAAGAGGNVVSNAEAASVRGQGQFIIGNGVQLQLLALINGSTATGSLAGSEVYAGTVPSKKGYALGLRTKGKSSITIVDSGQPIGKKQDSGTGFAVQLSAGTIDAKGNQIALSGLAAGTGFSLSSGGGKTHVAAGGKAKVRNGVVGAVISADTGDFRGTATVFGTNANSYNIVAVPGQFNLNVGISH